MQSPKISAGRLTNVDAGWTAGMNTLRHPWLLRADQYRRGVNISNRGGIAQTRPGFAMKLILPEGNLQGFTHFRMTKNDTWVDYLVAAVDGKVYAVPDPFDQPRNWDDFRIKNIQFDASVEMVYFCQAEKTVETLNDQTLKIVPTYNVLIMQDGVNAAAYWDGTESRHMNEAAPTLETPRGTWMTFSGGRLWVAREKIVLASDLFDPLKFVERTQGESRGDFSFPKLITGLTSFVGTKRTEVVTVFTEDRSEILESGIRDRTKWATTESFQSVLFPSTGCVAGRSVVFQAGLMWWYSLGGLVASDTAASTNLTSQMNFKDAEMAFSKQYMASDQSGICGLSFENFILMSAPIGQNLNSETFVLDYATMSEASADKIPSWSSVWTGIRPIQWVSATIGKRRRAFAASVDYASLSDGSHNHIWEAFMPEREDTFFELYSDYTTVEYRRPIYCEFETRLIGDGHDLKQFIYADLNFVEVGGDVSVRCDYRGMRGTYKNILCKQLIAPSDIGNTGAKISPDELDALGALKKQSRRVSTQTGEVIVDAITCENEHSENIDKAFSLLIRWCGQLAVESIRIFSEPYAEKSEGRCDADETSVCVVDETGANHIYDRQDGYLSSEELYLAAKQSLWASTQTYTETLYCPSDSVTGPLAVTAISTYRSQISQEDADSKALAAATQAAKNQAAALRPQYPCYWDSVKFVTRNCYRTVNSRVLTIAKDLQGRLLLGGTFWQDNQTPIGKLEMRSVSGTMIDTFAIGNGFVPNMTMEPSSIQVTAVAVKPTNGTIVAIGTFNQYNGTTTNRIAAINPTGDLNVALNSAFGTGTSLPPSSMLFLPDGSLILGWASSSGITFNGTTVTGSLLKLTPTGAIDTAFASSAGFSQVFDIAASTSSDGLITVAGTNTGGYPMVKKLSATTGAVQVSFAAYAGTTALTLNPADMALAVHTDGTVIFSSPGIESGKNLVKLAPTTGAVDTTFAANIGSGLNLNASAIAIDASGGIYLGGNFSTLNSLSAPKIVKLLSTGARDNTFAVGSGFDSYVNAIIVDTVSPAGIYVGGNFSAYNGNPNAAKFCKISTTGAFLPAFTSVYLGGSYRSLVSQAEADAQALANANAHAIETLPCT
jgi:hypothetical protein